MNRRLRGLQRGSALLEVALAMALMAMCGLGLLSAQLSLARHALASATRSRAAFAVDALAEVELESSTASRDQWRVRAAAIVPQGQVSVSSSFIALSWVAPPDEAAPVTQPPGYGCDSGATAHEGRACVALAITQ
ncbi:hypothetical protein [Paraburkholderia sp. J67]|uniref:type IV pilus modification PilV family protein n=1 Tax=Paraburkholderia sp. J67 TaxID=2805435 RepID=UPI002ABD3A67|nr:hypothetical protein [Paraburkholderia sp. J67]